MNDVALASAFVGATIGQARLAVAAKLLKMNAHAAQSAVKLIDAAQQNIDRLANVAAGIGGNIDINV